MQVPGMLENAFKMMTASCFPEVAKMSGNLFRLGKEISVRVIYCLVVRKRCREGW